MHYLLVELCKQPQQPYPEESTFSIKGFLISFFGSEFITYLGCSEVSIGALMDDDLDEEYVNESSDDVMGVMGKIGVIDCALNLCMLSW